MTHTLTIFIFGILFIAFVLPIIDGIIQIISAICELIKSNISTKIAENNCIIKLYQLSDSDSNVIGFDTGENIEEYDDDYEDEEDSYGSVIKSKNRSEIKSKNINRIGY